MIRPAPPLRGPPYASEIARVKDYGSGGGASGGASKCGWFTAVLQRLGFMQDSAYWRQELQYIKEKLKPYEAGEVRAGPHHMGPITCSRPLGALQVRFKPCKVFVVFNDETSQRLCLEKMTKGALQRHMERPTMRNRLVGACGCGRPRSGLARSHFRHYAPHDALDAPQ